MAARHDFRIDAGSTFERVLTYYASDGTTPIDLTGWTAKWRARRAVGDTTPVIDETPAVGGALGTVTLLLTGAETALLSPGRYLYAVRIAAPVDGEPSERLIEGFIDVSPDVIR